MATSDLSPMPAIVNRRIKNLYVLGEKVRFNTWLDAIVGALTAILQVTYFIFLLLQLWEPSRPLKRYTLPLRNRSRRQLPASPCRRRHRPRTPTTRSRLHPVTKLRRKLKIQQTKMIRFRLKWKIRPGNKMVKAQEITHQRSAKDACYFPKRRRTSWREGSGSSATYRRPKENTWRASSDSHPRRWKYGSKTTGTRWNAPDRRRDWIWTRYPHQEGLRYQF